MAVDKSFFDTTRPLFGGRLSQGVVDGMSRIVARGLEMGMSRPDLAYVLATIFHETAQWMQPIREGARRYGRKYSDAAAKRAVASIHAKGIIRTNYALPAGPYKQSYYGRGLVQITWYANYKKFTDLLGIPLDKNPDLALDWDTALSIAFIGMRDGMFTKYSLDEVPDEMSEPAFDRTDRLIINGDARKNGDRVASHAAVFWKALETTYDNQDVQARDGCDRGGFLGMFGGLGSR